MHLKRNISKTAGDRDSVLKDHQQGMAMGYQMWCEAVRLAILATAWLLVFIFCCFWCAICR